MANNVIENSVSKSADSFKNACDNKRRRNVFSSKLHVESLFPSTGIEQGERMTVDGSVDNVRKLFTFWCIHMRIIIIKLLFCISQISVN